MDTADIDAKIKDLTQRHKVVVNKQASLKGTLQAKKSELARLVQEIKDAGYDPKNLAQETNDAKQELLELIAQTDKALTVAETEINKLETP